MCKELIISSFLEGECLQDSAKARVTFDKKYLNKNLYIAAPIEDGFYIYMHDEALELFKDRFEKTVSWTQKGLYHTTTKYDFMKKYYFDSNSKEVNF